MARKRRDGIALSYRTRETLAKLLLRSQHARAVRVNGTSWARVAMSEGFMLCSSLRSAIYGVPHVAPTMSRTVSNS